MHMCPRRSSWSYRGFRVKVYNIPQQICRTCMRFIARSWEEESARYCFVIVTFCLVCCVLFGWIYLRDPCFQWEIRKSLCEDYERGLIAGTLCYDLCIEQTFTLSDCILDGDSVVTFAWHDAVVKARKSASSSSLYSTAVTTETSILSTPDYQPIWEGMSHEALWDALHTFFVSQLGTNDHSSLVDRVLTFTDFNQDNEIAYGEVYSVWQLLHIPEFLTLFLFQGNTIFPALNGTCGNLYSYQAVRHQILYEKSHGSFLDAIFPNRFRWMFPEFARRVHIALGLLEYASLAMEEANTRFLMCNLSPRSFGYTHLYEMKVVQLDGILSETMLNRTLTSTPCDSHRDCLYGSLCQSTCDSDTHHCQGINPGREPDLVKVCEILIDYIFYDTPQRLRLSLSKLFSRCHNIGRRKSSRSRGDMQVEQNVVMDELYKILWDELKTEQNEWLYPVTDKPF